MSDTQQMSKAPVLLLLGLVVLILGGVGYGVWSGWSEASAKENRVLAMDKELARLEKEEAAPPESKSIIEMSDEEFKRHQAKGDRDAEYASLKREENEMMDQYYKERREKGSSLALDAVRDQQKDRFQCLRDKADAAYEKCVSGN